MTSRLDVFKTNGIKHNGVMLTFFRARHSSYISTNLVHCIINNQTKIKATAACIYDV